MLFSLCLAHSFTVSSFFQFPSFLFHISSSLFAIPLFFFLSLFISLFISSSRFLYLFVSLFFLPSLFIMCSLSLSLFPYLLLSLYHCLWTTAATHVTTVPLRISVDSSGRQHAKCHCLMFKFN